MNIYPSFEDGHSPLNMPHQTLPDKNRDGSKLNTVIFNPVLVVADSFYRQNYTYYENGNLKLYTSQILKNGVWETWSRITVTYSDNGRVRQSFHELSQNDSLTSSSSIIDTLDAKGNLLTSVTVANDEVLTREAYTYTGDGKVLTALHQQFQYNQVMDADRTTVTYSDSGKLVNSLFERWKDNAWITIGRGIVTYDDIGNALTELKEIWANGTWITSSKYVSTFDDKGNRITGAYESWANGAVARSLRMYWTFDNNGNNLTFRQESLTNGIWVNVSKTTYNYDSNNSQTSYLDETWKDGSWVNNARCTYIYEKGNMISDIPEKWSNSAWLKSVKHDYKYDNYGNAVKGESFKWAAEAGTWVPGVGQLVLNYDGGKKGFIFPNSTMVEVQYGQFTGVKDVKTAVREFDLQQNYPNPFNPTTTINYSLTKAGYVRLSIYDALGRQIALVVDEYKPAGSYSVKFDGSSLPSGVYIYRLESGGYNASRKFVLMK